VVHNLIETPLKRHCDVFEHERSSSLGYDNVLPNPLYQSHVSSMCSQPSCFPEYYFNVPIDNFMICDSNVDLGREDNMFDVLGGNVANLL